MSTNFCTGNANLPAISKRFRYSPLDKHAKEIRTLQILPAQCKTSPVQLVVKHTHLVVPDQGTLPDQNDVCTTQKAKEAPEEDGIANVEVRSDRTGTSDGFIALSYQWGSPNDAVHEVYIHSGDHGGWTTVRQNLFDFLNTIRSPVDCSPWMWIDQICINQSDVQEKGHQVNQMSELYASAAGVEIWLGPAFTGSDEVMDMIKNTRISDSDVRRHLQDSVTEVTRASWTMVLERCGLLEHLPALRRIAISPYWSRLWIVQELFLGRNSTVRLGDRTVDFTSQFVPLFQDIYIPLLQKVTDHRYSAISNLLIWSQTDGQLSWDEALIIAETKGCQDGRDKFFAMLSLVKPELRFSPDYTLDFHNVLIILLRKVLEPFLNPASADELAFIPIELLAMSWCLTLKRYGHNVDSKVVRTFLKQEAHPVIRGYRSNTSISRTRRIGIVGRGPAWLAQMGVRLLLPGQNSIRWYPLFKILPNCRSIIPGPHQIETLSASQLTLMCVARFVEAMMPQSGTFKDI